MTENIPPSLVPRTWSVIISRIFRRIDIMKIGTNPLWVIGANVFARDFRTFADRRHDLSTLPTIQ